MRESFKGLDGDVRSDEDLWAHLRETLVAGPVPNCLQDLRQHEAPGATDRGAQRSDSPLSERLGDPNGFLVSPRWICVLRKQSG